MQKKYEEQGFAFAHNNTRYAGSIKGEPSDRCLPIAKEDFEEIVAFDSKFFPAKRPRFLECWLYQKDASAFMVRENGRREILGYGVIRKCIQGHKIGPLFASETDVAEALLNSLVSTVPREDVFLDVPEPNRAAAELAQKKLMNPVFSTARMYTKTAPALPLDKIYGITTFELG